MAMAFIFFSLSTPTENATPVFRTMIGKASHNQGGGLDTSGRRGSTVQINPISQRRKSSVEKSEITPELVGGGKEFPSSV